MAGILPQLAAVKEAFRAVKAHPGDLGAQRACLEPLAALREAAASAGGGHVEMLARHMEGVLRRAAEGRLALKAEALEAVELALSRMERLVGGAAVADDDGELAAIYAEEMRELWGRLDQVLGRDPVDVEEVARVLNEMERASRYVGLDAVVAEIGRAREVLGKKGAKARAAKSKVWRELRQGLAGVLDAAAVAAGRDREEA
ncbi:hypothetical protein HCU62_08540 [Dissulfurirhabdus thermomarina]|nr:hypothetical protein [Dissulfurirhabdus thermomarina]NMX23979.1 hypothetical protein [Dissulfurirhabdus thermomarina]